MKQKKATRKKKAKPAKKSSIAKKITSRGKVARKKIVKKPVRKKPVRKKPVRRKRTSRRAPELATAGALENKRINSRGAGSSGDNQKLSQVEDVDSESVEELIDEGQSYEAAAISGVEDALDPDQGEVTTKQVPEDDVPEEYKEKDQ
jgi:hypothetical protein